MNKQLELKYLKGKEKFEMFWQGWEDDIKSCPRKNRV